MKISGTAHLGADPATVFTAFQSPDVLVRTLPGCQRLEVTGPDQYRMTVAAGVGSIKGVYDGQVELLDKQEPESFRMKAQGAGAPGTIGADVMVTLAPGADGGTELRYDADAVVGGMIGGVGQRMLTGVSKKMAAEFFRNVDGALSGAPVAAGAPATSGLPVDVAPSTEAPGAAAPAGAVFTAPEAAGAAAGGANGFLLGVAVGACAALAGAVVGGWIAGRRR